MTLGEGRDKQVGCRAQALSGGTRTLFQRLHQRPEPHYKTHRSQRSFPAPRMHPSGGPQDPGVPAVSGASSPQASAHHLLLANPEGRSQKAQRPRGVEGAAAWTRAPRAWRARRCHIPSLSLPPASFARPPARRSGPGCAASMPAEAALRPAAPLPPGARRGPRKTAAEAEPARRPRPSAPPRPVTLQTPGPGPQTGAPRAGRVSSRRGRRRARARPKPRPRRASADTWQSLQTQRGTSGVDSEAARRRRVTELKTRLPPRPRDALAAHWLAAEGWAPIAVCPPSAPPPRAAARCGPGLPPRCGLLGHLLGGTALDGRRAPALPPWPWPLPFSRSLTASPLLAGRRGPKGCVSWHPPGLAEFPEPQPRACGRQARSPARCPLAELPFVATQSLPWGSHLRHGCGTPRPL